MQERTEMFVFAYNPELVFGPASLRLLVHFSNLRLTATPTSTRHQPTEPSEQQTCYMYSCQIKVEYSTMGGINKQKLQYNSWFWHNSPWSTVPIYVDRNNPLHQPYLCLKWHPISHLVHYFGTQLVGLCSKVMHYIGNRVQFGNQPRSPTLHYCQTPFNQCHPAQK